MKYSPQQYAKIFSELLEKARKHDRPKIIKDFAALLLQNGDIKNSDEVLYAAEKYLYEKDGQAKMEVTETKKSDLKLPPKINHKKLSVSRHSDPAIIGGVKMRIGDMVVDNSVRSRLSELNNIFK